RLLPHLARNQDFVAMFLDEARLASQLNHQNIVQVYELGRVSAGPEVEPLAGDTYFIAMEYVFGKNLAEIFRAANQRQAMLSSDNLVKVVLSVAVALDYAHSLTDHSLRPLGVVHRDISPANILLSYEGEIKLVDFGIAKALSQSSATKPGVLKGKFAYMSPEQAKGQPVDNRSDIFSLGIVLWEGLTGVRLFAADNEAAILKKVVEADPLPPSQAGSDCPPRLDAICLKCLAADRAARYQSAQDLAQDLEEYLRSLSTYPSTYSLRTHLFTLFAERIDQEREEIRQENEALRNLLAEGDRARETTAATLRSQPVYSPPVATSAGPAPSGPMASARPASSPVTPLPGPAPVASPPAPDQEGSPSRRSPIKLYLAAGAAAVVLLALFLFWPQ
ncbi:MAG: serine/threonine protein kinase, partial [Desulfovibrio sp.]|nr:serine/threonine protein kinase [Desulfovibrio sp.]